MQCYLVFMFCFIDDDKWFCWIIVQLLKKKGVNLYCLRCNVSFDVDKIGKFCKMIMDEELFFKLVKNLNCFDENFVDFIYNVVL